MFSAERLQIIETLIPVLQYTEHWDCRYDVEIYVSKCYRAGFAQTPDQLRLCAERFLAGKRKVTPPGTSRRKRDAKKMRAILTNPPSDLILAIDTVLSEQQKAVTQYKSGVDKALNALVGQTMKRYKIDPAIIRELLIKKIG